ncbi:MAG: phosphatase PAP2 family protein [Armatimonadota bacterium]
MQVVVVNDRPKSHLTVAHWGGLIAYLITICIVIAAQQHRIAPAVMPLAVFLSNLGNEMFIALGFLVLIIVAIKIHSKEDLKLAVWTFVLVTVVVHAMKQIYGYWLHRPSGGHGGFPSGHSATSFALAFLLSERFPKLSFLWYSIAVGISASRVMIGAHYPYQVFVGALVGCCLAIYLNEQVHPNTRLEDAARRWHWLIMSVPLVTAIMSFSYECESGALLLPGTAVFFILGMVLRVWARRHTDLAKSDGMMLCTSGPYSILRHPAYLGNILICIGVTFSTEVLWLIPLTILFGIAVYGMAARSEERDLMNRCGDDYEVYAQKVRRWLPSRKLSVTRKISPAGWGYALKRELPLLLLLVPACIKELIS